MNTNLPYIGSDATRTRALKCETLLFVFLPGRPSGAESGEEPVDELDEINHIRAKAFEILIIDDEKRFRDSIKLVLERIFSASVTAVTSGELGVENVKMGKTYDLIFLDIMLPAMSGVDVYRELKRVNEKCQIVFMSAYPNSSLWEEAKSFGATVLAKPISKQEYVQILGRL